MSEPFVAAVQYGDLRGTIAIDGHDGNFLNELTKHVKLANGYWPVGLGIHGLVPSGNDQTIPITIYAVDREQAGDNVEKIIEFAKRSEEFPVFAFRGRIAPATLFALMKRIDIKLLSKTFKAAENVVEYNAP